MCNPTSLAHSTASEIMLNSDPISTAPLFSIVIGVYDDWSPLENCLISLAQQTTNSAFEVIVVDDGSTLPAPEFINRKFPHPFTIVRQSHAGIAAARNRGVQVSKGSVLVCIDADCILKSNCLAALEHALRQFPQHSCFQLHLVGNLCGVVGKAEELRLISLQERMLQPDGRIRYLNTAGFAIRRERVDVDMGMFDPAAQRGEDTLLLANLMQEGELPFFISDAIVQHAISLSVWQCLCKDVRSAYHEGRTYNVIGSKGVRFRLSYSDRLIMLKSMWKISAQRSIGRSAWFVLVARQAVRLFVLLLTDIPRMRPKSNTIAEPSRDNPVKTPL
jgi:glycosyltransferase involved in cell wall biosynthesis